jgi:hypothetical protein
MATTYTLISSVTVGSGGAATISFTSIPSTYTDICIMASMRSLGSQAGFYIRPNGSTSNLSARKLYGDGASAASNTSASTIFSFGINYSGNTASTFSNVSIYIPNYASSNYKSISVDGVNETNATEAFSNFVAGLWSDTTAISSMTLLPESNSFAEYTTAYLYGISSS